MPGFLAPMFDRLNAAYRDRPVFEGLKARLLAAIALLIMAFIPFNIGKNMWIQPPLFVPRLIVNLVIIAAGAVCLRQVYKGRLQRAGNGLALALVLSIHGGVLIFGSENRPVQALSFGVLTFAFDFVILLFALLFATRRVALAVFGIIVAGHIGYYLYIRHAAALSTSEGIAAGTLLREGLLALGFVFALGITLMQMIDAAHRSSEEALRSSKSLNDHLERLEQEARGLSEKRRELLEVQREFISMVSHEFRTPLTTIQGAQFLLDRLLTESASLSGEAAKETKKWLNLQTSGLETLSKLVDQVLLLNRTEHMTGEASFESLSPGKVLAEAVGPFNDSAACPRVELQVDVAPDLVASMDPRLVKAAVENLVSNGLKYSALGSRVKVCVSGEPQGWVVEVLDEGRGIPLEDQASLFRPFFRAGNTGTVPGTGLGLVIVRRAVDFHGGRIEFESRENQGTRFVLHFPCVPRPSLDAPAPACLTPVPRE